MSEVTLLLGSNLGNRLLAIRNAEEKISEEIGNVVKRSQIYETASWGIEDQPPFLNQVIEVQTSLLPQTVMQKILEIENFLGRNRSIKWQSRVIDIDILLYGNEVIAIDNLIIPHPQLHKRRFTLVPLAEIAPSSIHPVLNKTYLELLEETVDSLDVKEYINQP